METVIITLFLIRFVFFQTLNFVNMPVEVGQGHFLPTCPDDIANLNVGQHFTPIQQTVFVIKLLANEIRHLQESDFFFVLKKPSNLLISRN